MGMYTELTLSIELNRNIPDYVIPVLQYLLGELEEEPSNVPENCWGYMFKHGSAYFDGQPQSSLTKYYYYDAPTYYLTLRFNIKNYQRQIPNFLEWIYPFTRTIGYVGTLWYEEFRVPALIFFDNGVRYVYLDDDIAYEKDDN